VFGSTGTEKVVVNSGVTGVVVDANVERVDLPGASSAYTFQQAGNQLKVFSGATVVATIPLQDDTDGTQVVFTNGSVSAKVGATGLTLGGATVPSTAAAAVTPTTIDATVTSGSGSSTGGTTTGQTFSLTTATETKALTTGNDTVDGATVANSADGDNIVDSLNTDSDVANITLTKAPTTGPVFANVEKINLALNYFDPSFDASKVTNGTIVVSTAQEGNSKATFTGVGTNGVKFEVGTGINTLTVNGTTSASDSTSIKLAGGNSTLTVGTTTLLETVALNSAGSAANVVTLTNSTSAETFSVTGSQDLTLKATATNLAGDTLTKAMDSGKTVAVQLTALAATADLKAVAADSFSTTSTSTALGANTLTFAAGTTNLTINGTDQLDNAASVLAATGTGTTDVLNLTLAADQANVDTSTFETVNLNYTGSTVDLSLATLKGGTVTSAVSNYVLTGARNVTLTSVTGKSANLSGLTGTSTATVTSANTTSGISVTTTGNNDTINLSSLTTGKGTVVAGAGNDTITGGAGDDSVNAGAGNDSITASAGNDSVDGGDGNDIINTGAGSNFVLGGAGDDTINLTTGTDAVVAGAGNDTVTVSGANLTSADTLVGGDGTDTVSITTAVLGAATAFDNVSGFENISFAALGANTVTAVDSLIASGATLTVDFATPTGIVTWNGSAETDGNLKLTVAASNFAHVVTGGAGADNITIGVSTTAVSVAGGAGADTIAVSGAAAHSVKGGAGADTIDMGTSVAGVIQLASITDSTTGSADAISNYTLTSEKVDLSAITNFTTTVASNVTASLSVGGIATGLYTASTSGAFTSLTDAITRVGADVKTAGSAVVFNYGSDAYVFVDVDGAATTSNDILVKLVGVTAGSAAAAASVITVS
jgi:hypothetical protein